MTDTRSEYEKMLAGDTYLSPNPELRALQTEGRARLRKFNETPREDYPARMAALKELFGRPVECWIETPLAVDYGIHIHIGKSFVNMNCVFLDSNRITIGDRVLIGTGVQLLTPVHPVDAADRFIPWPSDPEFPSRGVGHARPITIEDDCWIGSGAIVLPGVTIGRGTTVGAGSVVTKSLPPYVLAVGNPCRVIRQLEPRPSAFQTEAGKA